MIKERATGFFVSGGTLPLESQSYVERDCDAELYTALAAGRYCYVLNSRQMGKSSLSVRTLARLEAGGSRTACIDLTQMGGRNVTAEQWYTGLAVEMGRAFGLRSAVLAYCRQAAEFAPMQRFFGALREVILEQIKEPVVLCIDEIDATRNLSFDPDEFFAGIRECFNHRVRDAAYERLTICIIGVAVPSDLIRNPTTTPFNIGERVYLRDFSLAEMRKLALPLGRSGQAIVERIHYWTDGHPFLSQSLCAECLAEASLVGPDQVDALVERTLFGPKARDRNINLADVANRALNAGAREDDPERFRADLLSMYGRILRGKYVPDDEANRVASLLKLSGLVRSDGNRLCLRNRIYERVFDAVWIRDNMPGQELLRQQQSFRRGLIRAFALSAGFVIVVGLLAIRAWRSQEAEARARTDLDRELYVAGMNDLRSFAEDGDVARAGDVLDRNRNSPYRGFEWGFWMRRLHDSPEEYTLDYTALGKRESGIVSWDGSQICLLDDVTNTATIVDRRTRRALATVPRNDREDVVATPTGFVALAYGKAPVEVTTLPDRKLLCRLGDPRTSIEAQIVRPHTTVAATIQNFGGRSGTKTVALWRLSDGRRLLSRTGPAMRQNTTIAFSSDGSRILFGPDSDDKGRRVSTEYRVLDTATGKEIDRFDIPLQGNLLELAGTGKQVLYSEDPAILVGRDIDRHQTVYRHELTSGDSVSQIAFTDEGRMVARMDAAGHASVDEYPSGQPLATFDDVWSMSPSAERPELLAGSTSLRVLTLRGGSESGLLSQGDRLGRDGEGHIVVFMPGHGGIARYSDPALTSAGRIPPPQNIQTYTYNGKWRMTIDRSRNFALFNDAAGTQKPVAIAPIPANYSCGLSREWIAIYQERTKEIVGLSGETGAVTWRYPLGTGESNGLWMSPDDQFVFVFVRRIAVVVLDAHTGVVKGTITPHNLRVSSVAFTADGGHFFTFGFDGRAILWSLANLQPLVEYRGNAAQRVSGGDLSPDGRRAVTTTEGGLLQIWDAKTGVELSSVRASRGAVHGAMFTADGLSVVTVDADHVVRVWRSLDRDPSIRFPVEKRLLARITN